MAIVKHTVDETFGNGVGGMTTSTLHLTCAVTGSAQGGLRVEGSSDDSVRLYHQTLNCQLPSSLSKEVHGKCPLMGIQLRNPSFPVQALV